MLLKCDFYKCVLEQTYIDSMLDMTPGLLTVPCRSCCEGQHVTCISRFSDFVLYLEDYFMN